MTATYEIPLTPDGQIFNIDMAGTTYQMYFYWNYENATWMIDISDLNDVNILTGIPVVGNTDLLEQYTYLNFGCQLIAQTDFDINAAPTVDNLGTLGHVYFITP